MQLRARSFDNSQPRELDYYSPRRFDEVLPLLRLRRFHGGWMFAAAAGVGQQRESGADWRAARLAELTVESPRTSSDWYLRAHMLYSNTPVGDRSEEQTSELQSLMRITYAVLCLKKQKQISQTTSSRIITTY